MAGFLRFERERRGIAKIFTPNPWKIFAKGLHMRRRRRRTVGQKQRVVARKRRAASQRMSVSPEDETLVKVRLLPLRK